MKGHRCNVLTEIACFTYNTHYKMQSMAYEVTLRKFSLPTCAFSLGFRFPPITVGFIKDCNEDVDDASVEDNIAKSESSSSKYRAKSSSAKLAVYDVMPSSRLLRKSWPLKDTRGSFLKSGGVGKESK